MPNLPPHSFEKRVTQAGLDVSLDWFLVSPTETVVKGDVLHSDGLRVLLFASDESLRIMARARTILRRPFL